MLPFLLFTLLAQAQEKPPALCAVSGTAVDAVTGQPLAKVAVELRPTNRAANLIAATRSDTEGRFQLVDVDAGSYRLAGNRVAYLEAFYGARRSESEGAILRLDAGQTVDDVKLKMMPSGVIAGRVLDPAIPFRARTSSWRGRAARTRGSRSGRQYGRLPVPAAARLALRAAFGPDPGSAGEPRLPEVLKQLETL